MAEWRIEELRVEAEVTRCRCWCDVEEGDRESFFDVESSDEEASMMMLVVDEHFDPPRTFGHSGRRISRSRALRRRRRLAPRRMQTPN